MSNLETDTPPFTKIYAVNYNDYDINDFYGYFHSYEEALKCMMAVNKDHNYLCTVIEIDVYDTYNGEYD